MNAPRLFNRRMRTTEDRRPMTDNGHPSTVVSYHELLDKERIRCRNRCLVWCLEECWGYSTD